MLPEKYHGYTSAFYNIYIHRSLVFLWYSLNLTNIRSYLYGLMYSLQSRQGLYIPTEAGKLATWLLREHASVSPSLSGIPRAPRAKKGGKASEESPEAVPAAAAVAWWIRLWFCFFNHVAHCSNNLAALCWRKRLQPIMVAFCLVVLFINDQYTSLSIKGLFSRGD